MGKKDSSLSKQVRGRRGGGTNLRNVNRRRKNPSSTVHSFMYLKVVYFLHLSIEENEHKINAIFLFLG